MSRVKIWTESSIVYTWLFLEKPDTDLHCLRGWNYMCHNHWSCRCVFINYLKENLTFFCFVSLILNMSRNTKHELVCARLFSAADN